MFGKLKADTWSLYHSEAIFLFCSFKMKKLEVVKMDLLPHFLFLLSLAKHFHLPVILICFAPFVLVASAQSVLFILIS